MTIAINTIPKASSTAVSPDIAASNIVDDGTTVSVTGGLAVSTTMSSGSNAVASGNSSFATGFHTTSSGQYSTSSGYYSTASGYCSSASGYRCDANQNFAIAEGQYAQTHAQNAYLWSDGSTNPFTVTTPNTFNVNATGGFVVTGGSTTLDNGAIHSDGVGDLTASNLTTTGLQVSSVSSLDNGAITTSGIGTLTVGDNGHAGSIGVTDSSGVQGITLEVGGTTLDAGKITTNGSGQMIVGTMGNAGLVSISASGGGIVITLDGTSGAIATQILNITNNTGTVLNVPSGGITSLDGGAIITDGSGALTATQFIGLLPEDSGWTANADAGDKTAIIPANATVVSLVAALDPTNIGYGNLIATMAYKIKALETALALSLMPNA